MTGGGVLGSGRTRHLGFFLPVAVIPAGGGGRRRLLRRTEPRAARHPRATRVGATARSLERGDSPPRPNVLSALDVWR